MQERAECGHFVNNDGEDGEDGGDDSDGGDLEDGEDENKVSGVDWRPSAG